MIGNRFLLSILAFTGLTLCCVTSCKKKKAFNAETGQTVEDTRIVQGQNDVLINDINLAIITQSLLTGRGFSESPLNPEELCGIKLDTTEIILGILKLNYDATECKGMKRTGKITISFMNYPDLKWKHQGCMLKVDMINYKSVRISDGRSVEYNGTAYLTNESNNSWYEMRYLNAPKCSQIFQANHINLSFINNRSATFNFNRRMIYTYSNKVTTCMVEGLGTARGKDKLDCWGFTRDDTYFTSQITSPLLWKSTCGGNVVLEGELIFKEDEKNFEMKCKFGVDQEGNLSEGSSCPYGWKMTWSHKKKTSKRIVEY